MSIVSTPQPFTIDISPKLLDWVRQRLDTCRLVPDVLHPPGEEWIDGTPTSEMNRLVDYWKDLFDWRSVEQKLNETFKMFIVDLEEAGEVIHLHYVHHRSKRPDAIPLLFVHGWPGNFTEVENLLKLVDPEEPSAQAFHIVAPSIPGFVFSSSPKNPGFGTERMGFLFHKLMNTLGYKHYLGQGGDLGSFILRSMAIQQPHACVGIHLNFIMSPPPALTKHPLTLFWLALKWFTPDQKKRIERMQWWFEKQFGYAHIQGTKPQSISYGLMDSPVGLLAWIREKLASLTEPGFVWRDETIITWVMLYLVSGSSGSCRIYKENFDLGQKEVFDHIISSKVAVGVSHFVWDTAYLPEWWAQTTVAEKFVFWREHDSGGHFASIEKPLLLVQDVNEFVAQIQGERREALIKAGQ